MVVWETSELEHNNGVHLLMIKFVYIYKKNVLLVHSLSFFKKNKKAEAEAYTET